MSPMLRVLLIAVLVSVPLADAIQCYDGATTIGKKPTATVSCATSGCTKAIKHGQSLYTCGVEEKLCKGADLAGMCKDEGINGVGLCCCEGNLCNTATSPTLFVAIASASVFLFA